jgi:prephenate dehydrogenase
MGLGLLGGSLARDLKDRPNPPLIRAHSLDAGELAAALAGGVIDEIPLTPEAFFHGLELVLYCAPLGATLRLLEEHRKFMEPGTLISDVVSLKAPVLERVKALGLESSFVGSHPMAGGEGSGFSSSRAGMFREARVWIVSDGASESLQTRTMRFWESLGARAQRVDALEHDALMAWTSHLPQVTATALGTVLAERGLSRTELGPGGRDMTRLAGSSSNMWKDILAHAPPALPEALRALEKALAEMRERIERGQIRDVEDQMIRTRSWFEGDLWR